MSTTNKNTLKLMKQDRGSWERVLNQFKAYHKGKKTLLDPKLTEHMKPFRIGGKNQEKKETA